jgi:NAD(P)-dependent dehydrogenase (short-subunit alcohol dehydrogenase family)
VAVVTGALGLLGKEHCRALSRFGARVVVGDLSQRASADFADELLLETGNPVLGVALDVTDAHSIAKLETSIRETLGPIDILVNNAGINDRVEDATAGGFPFEGYPLEAWDRVMRVNVTGTFLCCQIIGSCMARTGRGSIINIASTYGLVAPRPALYQDSEGQPEFFKSPAYPTSKGAVLAFTRYLAAHWGSSGVRVNALVPGGVENGQKPSFRRRYAENTPLGRMARSNDYHGALLFLASDASSYMTGAQLVVDGGWTAW